jgi:PAS domain S-box
LLRPRRVRTWLVLLVTACVLPLVLFSTVLLLRNANAQAEATERRVSDQARLLAEDVDREIARVVAAAEVLVTAESLANNNFAAFYARAVRVRDLLGTNVLIRDLTGQQIVNTRVPWETALPRNPEFEVDRRAVETRRPQVSGLLTGAVARAPLLIVVVPVIHDGAVTHLLSLTISQERLNALLSPERLPDGWVAGIVDRDGIIIARSKNAQLFVGTRLLETRWAAIKDVPEGVHRTTDLDEAKALQAYSRAPISGWLIGVSVPEALVAEPARQTLAQFVGGGLVLFLCGLGVTVLLGRRLTRPIMHLAQAAQALGAGQSVPAGMQGVEEIDTVGQALRDAAALIQQRAAALQESEARLRRVVDGAPFPIIVHTENGEILYVSRSLTEMTGYAREEIATIAAWNERVHDGEREGQAGDAMLDIDRLYALDRPIDEGESTIRLADGRTRLWTFRSAPIGRDEHGRRLVVSMAADLTERKEAEKRLRLLMREVDHRAKNALAVVQSVVQLSRAEDPATFTEAVQGRVAAIARAHTLLAETRWSGADLATMLRMEFEPFAANQRISLTGPTVAIAAEAAQAMSIVLHEMATNAAKHGALSTQEGRVEVSWSVSRTTGRLVLDWQESDGPPVRLPSRFGFGSFIIAQTVKDQLRGDLNHDWDRAGLRWCMTMAPECFVTSGIRDGGFTTPKPANDEPQKPAAGTRVLVVEDEALTAIALSQLLQTKGFEVLGPVGRVQDAIDLARADRPDAAVLDVNLFGQLSFPVAEVLDGMGVPFLFCTGYGSLEAPNERLRRAPILRKPASPDQVTRALNDLLASRKGSAMA